MAEIADRRPCFNKAVPYLFYILEFLEQFHLKGMKTTLLDYLYQESVIVILVYPNAYKVLIY